MSPEIRPLVALYPPPPHIQKMCCIGLRSRATLLISALSGRRGRYAHAYGICTPFYCISLKNIYRGGPGVYNAVRGVILRVIVEMFIDLID